MGVEIERKFLVTGPFPRASAGQEIRQGYLARHPERAVRVRLAGDRAWLTVKGRSEGASRLELEYPIPVDDARAMLELCEPGCIDKTRYEVEHDGLTWEVDVFAGDNEGLVVDEVELGSPDKEVSSPAWVGAEVTEDRRYLNAVLSEHPYAEWDEAYSVILYYDRGARARGEALAERLRARGFRVRADAWSDAREPDDPILSAITAADKIHYHPSAARKAASIRDELAPSLALVEGDVVTPGSTWAMGPRSLTILLVTPS